MATPLLFTSLFVASIVGAGAVKMRAQYDSPPAAAAERALLLAGLNASHSDAYNVLLWDTDGANYLQMLELAQAVQGTPLQLWVTLIPPTETTDGRCSHAADSPLTPFNDSAYLNPARGPGGCNDYAGWSRLIAALAGVFPGVFYAVNVDDFSSNVGDAFAPATFRPPLVAAMKEALTAGGVKLIPTFYHDIGVLDSNAWLKNATDGVLFYFRNDLEGQATCRTSCAAAPPADCGVPCLWGQCAELSLGNLGVEVAAFASWLGDSPSRGELHVGLYFSAYNHCAPGPSVLYDFTALVVALRLPVVRGATIYTYQPVPVPTAADGGCAPGDELRRKGCAVRYAFGAM